MNDFADVDQEQAAPERQLMRADAINERAEVDSLIRLLNQPGDHRKVFQFAGRAIVVTRDRSVVLKSGKGGADEVIRAVPRTANDGLLKGPIGMVTDWVKFFRSPDPGEDRLVKIPSWVTKMIIDIYGEGLKPLAGVADFPVIDGFNQLLCGHIGYDPATRLYVDCEPVSMDGNKFKDDPQAAYEWLCEEFLADFPFASEQDMARALAIPLTILSRRTRIYGGAPLPFVTSPTPETGKTLLTQCLVEVITGQQIPVSAWDHDNDAERRKMLLAIAMENPAAVLFDNINNGWAVSDATLDKYVTSDAFSDRLLGKNENARAPATTLPIFTGNNIGPGSIDLESRSFEIRLEMPKKRPQYKRRNVLGWVHANRVKILQALVTIATAKVRPSYIPQSRFPAWAEEVGARLQYACKRKDLFPQWAERDQGSWNEELEALCEAMAGIKHDNENAYGYTPGQMSELFSEKMAELEPDKTAPWMRRDEKLIVHGKVPPKQVHNVLKKYKGHIAGNWRFSVEKKPLKARSDRNAWHFKALEV